ncbi:hypothetical protein EXIGLDRAFT_704179 [Exidia glandulosa HHB12029]|uniref:Zn(2)-C6 fungal-type domain-containing protein n=1 Tax=Exidia glandulosa HHB12029 TaxID=1314781 RepID=A0A165KZU4_EXIGL|nr:hypothetical protein EXIGLDRAFT_704179 [Exidia glandulosa HHB12029]
MSTINSAVADSSSSGARRKNGKHSCDQCKVRKCKCDEAVPCGKCTQCGSPCTYLGEDKRKKRPAAAEKLQQCAAKILRLKRKVVTLGGINTPSEPASPTSPVHASLGERPPVEPQGHDPHVANVCNMATNPVCPGCVNTPLSCQWWNFDFVAMMTLAETNTLLLKRLTEVLQLFDKLVEDPYWIPTGSCECSFCCYTSTSRYDLKVR